MHRKTLTSLTASQRVELASLIKKYTKKPGVLHQHMEWHMANGSGGTTGPGSGERFLAFHRNYIGKLEDWIKTQVTDDKKLKKFVPLPKQKPSTLIPIQFAFPGRLTDNPKINTPTWLTVKGGTTASPEFDRKSLGKFNTSDDIWSTWETTQLAKSFNRKNFKAQQFIPISESRFRTDSVVGTDGSRHSTIGMTIGFDLDTN